MGEKSTFFRYQLAGWLIAYSLFTLYTYQRFCELLYAAGLSTSAFISFAIIIYIFPRLHAKNVALFFMALLALVFVVSLIRMYVEFYWMSELFGRKSFFTTGSAHFSYVLVTNFVALLLGVLLKGVSESFLLKEKQKELEKRRLTTEMKLLKAQLQPHFLFNSLNNIYYEAYKESPRTARLIEKLSEIMRFFVDASAKEKIPIGLEITFIRNIIDMEQIRCHNAIMIEFVDKVDPGINVPPMLMIPLVENVFKHGIDKRQTDNYISILIEQPAAGILFRVRNRIYPQEKRNGPSGTGLKNLQERLSLLYGGRYELKTVEESGFYTVTLIIPEK